MKLFEEEMLPVKIDLNTKVISESFLSMFGESVKIILRRMFDSGAIVPKGTVTGTQSQISAFEDALVANKRYIDSYMENGLNNPSTYRSKYTLETAVGRFERQTGIKWPFK